MPWSTQRYPSAIAQVAAGPLVPILSKHRANASRPRAVASDPAATWAIADGYRWVAHGMAGPLVVAFSEIPLRSRVGGDDSGKDLYFCSGGHHGHRARRRRRRREPGTRGD